MTLANHIKEIFPSIESIEQIDNNDDMLQITLSPFTSVDHMQLNELQERKIKISALLPTVNTKTLKPQLIFFVYVIPQLCMHGADRNV